MFQRLKLIKLLGLQDLFFLYFIHVLIFFSTEVNWHTSRRAVPLMLTKEAFPGPSPQESTLRRYRCEMLIKNSKQD
jgi:hypothetical protein